ncbi:hypothetical protein [Syntrophotalea acetylenica]|uniref:WGR domain-containing protein n=1 Tax=Syntrophotalea acetylenica TaxID=29542 RepID=A0A1L3GDB6_SYNAC|nr:hypothetical protein [Syntrophotalea acetylenica]APG23933.1 hypothetical protein A7E75_02015 [Syntrophotalea acetylenica]APG44514.1 hypothetical protein A6070_10635 [Syntrophotalea acetylenica]MDY0227128.1 hypothetical protein [Desulfomicrobium apsheronum]
MQIPQNTICGVWMRCPNAHGGKDWLGFLTGEHVLSCWGRTGQIRQSRVLSNHPSRNMLKRKINEKLAKGYDIIAVTYGAVWSRSADFQPGLIPDPPGPAQNAPPKENRQAQAVSRWIEGSSQAWF